MSLRALLDAKAAEKAKQEANLPIPPVPGKMTIPDLGRPPPIETAVEVKTEPEKPKGFSSRLGAAIAAVKSSSPIAKSTAPKDPYLAGIQAKAAPPAPVDIAAKPPEFTGPMANMDKIRENLQFLANNIEQKELVGDVVRTIAVQLQQNPVLGDHLSDGDIDLIVRGLRRAFQTASRVKTEKRYQAKARNEQVDEIGDIMKGLGLTNFNS
jgi:hypothetical protein